MADSSVVPAGDGLLSQTRSDKQLIQSLRDTLGVRPSAEDPQPSDPHGPLTRVDDHTGGEDAGSRDVSSRRRAQQGSVSQAALAVADEILAIAGSTAQDWPSSESEQGAG